MLLFENVFILHWSCQRQVNLEYFLLLINNYFTSSHLTAEMSQNNQVEYRLSMLNDDHLPTRRNLLHYEGEVHWNWMMVRPTIRVEFNSKKFLLFLKVLKVYSFGKSMLNRYIYIDVCLLRLCFFRLVLFLLYVGVCS